MLGWDALADSVDTAIRLRTLVSADVLDRIEAEHPRLRRFVPVLLATFTFQGGHDMANRLGQLHDQGDDARQRRAAGCNLIVAAIILWNTVYLARATHALKAVSIDVPDTILQHVWPLAWDHIILTGDYRWSNDNPRSTETLRPLRLDRITPRIAA